MDSSYFFVFWFLFIIAMLVMGLVITPTKDKHRLYALLASRGATEIDLHQRGWGGNKNHRSYQVTYRDTNGAYQEMACLITGAFWSEPEVYWLDKLGVQNNSGERNQPRFSDTSRVSVLEADHSHAALPPSAKDQLIRRLLDENKQLRLELQNRRNSI